MQQVKLTVYGMSCEGCTNTVRTTLEKFNGVKKVSVNLMPPEATVLYEDNIIPNQLIKHLEKNSHYKALVKID